MVKQIVRITLNGVALAMGVAVVVTSGLNTLDAGSAFAMLGIGLFALALVSLQDERS